MDLYERLDSPRVKARKRTAPSLCCANKRSAPVGLESARVKGKTTSFISPLLSALSSRHVLFFSFCCREESHSV